jgi:hypothetical protein
MEDVMVMVKPIIIKNFSGYRGIIKVKIIPPIKTKSFVIDNLVFEKKEEDIYVLETSFVDMPQIMELCVKVIKIIKEHFQTIKNSESCVIIRQ